MAPPLASTSAGTAAETAGDVDWKGMVQIDHSELRIFGSAKDWAPHPEGPDLRSL